MVETEDLKIVLALKLLQSLSRKRWLRFLKTNEDKLPYFVAQVAHSMDSAVRDLCPPGYEADR